jgi:poly(A) polymerase Pap1
MKPKRSSTRGKREEIKLQVLDALLQLKKFNFDGRFVVNLYARVDITRVKVVEVISKNPLLPSINKGNLVNVIGQDRVDSMPFIPQIDVTATILFESSMKDYAQWIVLRHDKESSIWIICASICAFL